MRTHAQARRGGFTLMELLVAIALMVFLMSIVVQIFITSTEVFNRAKAKTEIYQSARYALDRMGKEINNCLSMELGNQDFRVGAPRGSNVPYWYGVKTSFSATDDDGMPVTAPYLVLITSTSWVDSSGKQVVGSAKVAYRVKRNPVPDTVAAVTATMQRVLFVPDATKGIASADRLKDSKGASVGNIDYCQYIYFDKDGTAHLDVQHFVADPSIGGSYSEKKYYQVTAGSLKDFKTTNAAPFNQLPTSVRVIMDVIDEKDREIRTLSRQYMIYSSVVK